MRFNNHVPPKLLILVGVLLVVVGISVSFLIAQQDDLEIIPTIPEQTANKPSSVSGGSWQTYTNKEYGFELQYPAGLTQNFSSDDMLYIGNQTPENGVWIYIKPNTQKLSITAWMEKMCNNTFWDIFSCPSNYPNKETVVIGSYEGLSLSKPNTTPGSFVVIIPFRDKMMVVTRSGSVPHFQQMLSSIKFEQKQ